MSPAIIFAGLLVLAFAAGFGSCLMLLHHDRKEPM